MVGQDPPYKLTENEELDGARATEQHVILIGYRGSGKTVVGRLLAGELRRPHVDTDLLIEDREGRTIAAIFEQDGEPYFRKIESEVIDDLASGTPKVISVGGGAVAGEHNRKRLKGLGTVVWLRAAPEELYRRVVADRKCAASRPPLSTADALTEVRMLLAERSGSYEELADVEIDTTGKSVVEVTQMILRQLESKVYRDGPQPARDETEQESN